MAISTSTTIVTAHCSALTSARDNYKAFSAFSAAQSGLAVEQTALEMYEKSRALSDIMKQMFTNCASMLEQLDTFFADLDTTISSNLF